MDSFDSMFDYNHDGELDREERVLQYEFLEEGEKDYASYGGSKRSKGKNDTVSNIIFGFLIAVAIIWLIGLF